MESPPIYQNQFKDNVSDIDILLRRPIQIEFSFADEGKHVWLKFLQISSNNKFKYLHWGTENTSSQKKFKQRSQSFADRILRIFMLLIQQQIKYIKEWL